MEGVIKQWFMWVKPNFENVGAFFEFNFQRPVMANFPVSTSTRSGRMRT